jgi:hypothetical protein
VEIPLQLIEDVEAVAPELISMSGVTGVGLGFREENGEFFDELAVRLLVADASDVPAGISEEIAGVPVCVVEFPVEPLFVPDTARYQDLLGGTQIQPAPLGSGTLGAIVQDANGGRVGLTCHHVVGDPGTTVWQPVAPLVIAGAGPPDLTDSIGEVIARESPATQTIPVPAGSLLLLGREIDAATVGLDAAVNQGRTISDAIADGFGTVDSTSSPNVGMFVKKRGSQTGPTSGQVVGIQVIVPWLSGQPPPGHAYVMSRQYEIFYNPVGCPDGIFSAGGDSGSLVLEDGTQTAVGLLWGGLPAGGIRAVMCHNTKVEDRLGLSVVWSEQ